MPGAGSAPAQLFDVAEHCQINLQKKRFGLCLKMGKSISASTFISDVYRRMELQNNGEVHPSSLQADSRGYSNNSAVALLDVLTDYSNAALMRILCFGCFETLNLRSNALSRSCEASG